jgi:hypothetical protein
MRKFWLFICAWVALLFGVFMLPELANAQQDAQQITYNEPVRVDLPAGESREYTFSGTAGDKLTIAMTAIGGDMDPVIDVYNPQGRLIAEGDDEGEKLNAYLQGIVLPEDGVYRVVASNKRNADGRFSLMINQEQADGEIILYEGEQFTQPYQLSAPWNKNDLTYALVNTLGQFREEEIRQVIEESFAAWAEITPLTFTEVDNPRQADIVIEFDGIDGPLNVLGEACPPSSPCAGSVRFDADESWVLREPEGYRSISLLAVASHEFGHAIGLLHSQDTSALMYAAYSPYNLQPGPDDIRGAQQLYGAGRGSVNGGSATTNEEGEPVVQGALSDNQWVEYWDFDVVAGELVTLSMESVSGGLDPFLVVLDANNRILAFDDDSGEGQNALLRDLQFPESGTYTVAATRYQQAQGYTGGDYELTIEYGESSAEVEPGSGESGGGSFGGGNNNDNNNNGTTGSGSTDAGGVSVSAGRSTDIGRNESLDTTLDRPFTESTSPDTQRRNATVSGDTVYNWETTWCAADEQTLLDNLASLDVSFAVNGREIDRNIVSQSRPFQGGENLSCVMWYLILSDWSAGNLTLTRTLSVRDPIFDGFSVYDAGDYVNEYNVTVR